MQILISFINNANLTLKYQTIIIIKYIKGPNSIFLGLKLILLYMILTIRFFKEKKLYPHFNPFLEVQK